MGDRRRSQPSKDVQVAVFRRDHWLCRWCKKPVVFAPAMKYLQRELENSGYSNLAYWRLAYTRRDAPLLDELSAVVDHFEAFATGGLDSIENFVTACNRCNMRKSTSDPAKWEREHPIKPIKGRYGEPENWDGLSTVFVFFAERDPAMLAASEKQWLQALKRPSSQAQAAIV